MAFDNLPNFLHITDRGPFVRLTSEQKLGIGPVNGPPLKVHYEPAADVRYPRSATRLLLRPAATFQAPPGLTFDYKNKVVGYPGTVFEEIAPPSWTTRVTTPSGGLIYVEFEVELRRRDVASPVTPFDVAWETPDGLGIFMVQGECFLLGWA